MVQGQFIDFKRFEFRDFCLQDCRSKENGLSQYYS